MSEHAAASQNDVVPPLPSSTSYPSGSENSSARPARTRPTTVFTPARRWLVPRYPGAASARAATAAVRTLDGPDPKRPSAGSRSAGMRISGTDVSGTCDSMAAMGRISTRIGAVAESATLAIDAKAKALKAAGENVVGFGAGEPDFPTPAHIVEAAVAACRDPKAHKYTPTPGLPELREAIAAKTTRDSGLRIEAAQVLEIGRATCSESGEIWV